MPSTPTRKPAAERRAEIAAAARAIALDAGLSAITMRAVAQRLGVSPTLVVHYAPSMDEVVADAFVGIVSAELAEIEELAAGLPSGRERIAGVLATLLDGSRADVTAVWVQSWALGGRNEPLAVGVREQMDAWRAVLAGVIAAGVATGEFRVADPLAVAGQILGMIDGLNAHSLVGWQGDSERFALMMRAVDAMLGV